MLILNK